RSQGMNALDSTNYFWDINADLGGRIVRDKLWFYGSLRDRGNEVTKLGLVFEPGPDAAYGTADDVQWFPTATNRILNTKLSYQMTSKYQASWYFNHEGNVDNSAHAGRFQPYEATSILRYAPI